MTRFNRVTAHEPLKANVVSALEGLVRTLRWIASSPLGRRDTTLNSVWSVCYTGGWLAELIIQRTWPHWAEPVAPISFALEITFAVIVTLSPVPLIGLAAVLQWAAQRLG